MTYRALSILLFIACALTAAAGMARAAPSTAAFAPAASMPPLLLHVGGYGGCGWDYPCAPRPDYGRRFYRREGGVTIHNNYGEVNIYSGEPRHREPRRDWDERDCGGGRCGWERRRENCGAWCWVGRIRKGYCGHGCWAYRERERLKALEEEERAERWAWEHERKREERREERAGCARDDCPGDSTPPPPPYYEPRDWDYAPRRAMRPRPYRGPRRRYDGPYYAPK
ncbi:MAG: hypothetical protein ACLPPF_19445 [Rhodomicrobium sp.]